MSAMSAYHDEAHTGASVQNGISFLTEEALRPRPSLMSSGPSAANPTAPSNDGGVQRSPRHVSDDNSDQFHSDTMDTPTLSASHALDVAAAFEKTRAAQSKQHDGFQQESVVHRDRLQDWRQYRMADWTPDRGSNLTADERVLLRKPALVSTGRHAGKLQVKYTSNNVQAVHMWHQEFFLSLINLSVWKLVAIYIWFNVALFFFFSGIWYAIWRSNRDCVAGIHGYVQNYIFAMITQQAIGYGNSYPNNCAWAAWIIAVQALLAVLIHAAVLGLVVAKLSHPVQRARMIFMSERAVIGRRDGILKLMFRIADIKATQAVRPTVRAYMFTWGSGRTTVEGEFIPVRSEMLELNTIDGMLLLPITIEHNIDERSPLCGHTFDSLVAMNAEIVVTFEGITEMGRPFMSRQSYLASEIRWGYKLVRCIRRPKDGSTQYTVDFSKFHLIEPHDDIPTGDQSVMSKAVVFQSKRTVPYPILGENTLVLSESMCLTEDDGQLCLMLRIGDTYPNQLLNLVVRAYVYRWPSTDCEDFTAKELHVGFDTGRDRLLLWLPVVVKHVIDDTSPLANWRTMAGFLSDATSYISVMVGGYMYSKSQCRMRLRIYNCYNDVRLHQDFAHMVTVPTLSADRKPQVDWTRFHITTVSADRDSAQHPPASQNESSKDASQPRGGEAELSSMTYEGDTVSSQLPHLDPESTFNRREGQVLAMHSMHRSNPRESYYEGSTDVFKRTPRESTQTESQPPLPRTDLQRSGLPAAWRLSGRQAALEDDRQQQ